MKFAILSDIHGNLFALEECFRVIQKENIDAVIWCGDYITDIPKSHEVIAFIQKTMQQYRSYIIRGNRENYILEYHHSKKKDWSLENRNGPLLCAYNELSKQDISFLESLPEKCIIPITSDKQVYVSHKIEKMDERKYCYKIYGHSHKQYLFEQENNRYLNPGSVGLGINANGVGAEFAILQVEQKLEKIEMYHIDYDITKPVQAIMEGKIDNTIVKWGDGLIRLLKTGINYPEKYVEEVEKQIKKRGLGETLDTVPLEIWHKARKKLGI